jgi:hypothetical protein
MPDAQFPSLAIGLGLFVILLSFLNYLVLRALRSRAADPALLTVMTRINIVIVAAGLGLMVIGAIYPLLG